MPHAALASIARLLPGIGPHLSSSLVICSAVLPSPWISPNGSALGCYVSWVKCTHSHDCAVQPGQFCCCWVPVLWLPAKPVTCICRSTSCMRHTSSTCQSAATLITVLTAYGPTCNGSSPMQSKFVSGCSQQARPNESLYFPMWLHSPSWFYFSICCWLLMQPHVRHACDICAHKHAERIAMLSSWKQWSYSKHKQLLSVYEVTCVLAWCVQWSSSAQPWHLRPRGHLGMRVSVTVLPFACHRYDAKIVFGWHMKPVFVFKGSLCTRKSCRFLTSGGNKAPLVKFAFACASKLRKLMHEILQADRMQMPCACIL